MKKLSFLLILALVGISIYLAGNYHLVRTNNGMKFVEKGNFGLADIYVDTTDWTPMDYLKNKEISAALAADKVKDFKGVAVESWNDFSSKLENMIENYDHDDTSRKAKKEIQRLKEATRKKYDQLEASLKKQEINAETFKEKLAELRQWTEEELEKLQN